MKSGLSSIQLERPKNLREQIRDAVRELLLANQFSPGEKLPSTRDLAATWGTDVCTVHTALAALEKEGLLVRRNRKGTFVRRREEKLTRVGIYLLDHYNAREGSPYARSIAEQAQSLLHEQGIQPDVWVDPRPWAKKSEPWPELEQAAQERRIQGLIIPQGGPPVTDWFAKLPIPWSIANSSGQANSVTLDFRQFITGGLRALADQGCRTIALLGPFLADATDADGAANPYAQWASEFVAVCRELGLECREEWVLATQRVTSEVPREQQGYALVHQLWSCRQHPEALMVFPDDIVGSAVAALLELGVRVPADLKLALHKNRHIPVFCPWPATFVVSDEAKIAAALIEQTQRQWRGEPGAAMTISFDLVANTDSQQTCKASKE